MSEFKIGDRVTIVPGTNDRINDYYADLIACLEEGDITAKADAAFRDAIANNKLCEITEIEHEGSIDPGYQLTIYRTKYTFPFVFEAENLK